MNQELKNYIHQERRQGASDETIKQKLRDEGWSDDMFTDYFLTETSHQQPSHVEKTPNESKNHNALILIILGAIIVLAGGAYFTYAQGFFNFKTTNDTTGQEEAMIEDNNMVDKNKSIKIIHESDLGQIGERIDMMACAPNDERLILSIEGQAAKEYYLKGKLIENSELTKEYIEKENITNKEIIKVDGNEITFELVEVHYNPSCDENNMQLYYDELYKTFEERPCDGGPQKEVFKINGYETEIGKGETNQYVFDNDLVMHVKVVAFDDNDIMCIKFLNNNENNIEIKNKEKIVNKYNFENLINDPTTAYTCQKSYEQMEKIYSMDKNAYSQKGCEEIFGTLNCNEEDPAFLIQYTASLFYSQLGLINCATEAAKDSNINTCDILEKYQYILPIEDCEYCIPQERANEMLEYCNTQINKLLVMDYSLDDINNEKNWISYNKPYLDFILSYPNIFYIEEESSDLNDDELGFEMIYNLGNNANFGFRASQSTLEKINSDINETINNIDDFYNYAEKEDYILSQEIITINDHKFLYITTEDEEMSDGYLSIINDKVYTFAFYSDDKNMEKIENLRSLSKEIMDTLEFK